MIATIIRILELTLTLIPILTLTLTQIIIKILTTSQALTLTRIQMSLFNIKVAIKIIPAIRRSLL